MHDVPSSSQRTAWSSGWKPDSDSEDPKFKSEPETAKKTKTIKPKTSNQNHQTGGTVPNPTRMKALVAQRQSVYNIIGHPT